MRLTQALCIYYSLVVWSSYVTPNSGNRVLLQHFSNFSDPTSHAGFPCSALIYGRSSVLLQLDMPCLIDTHRRPAHSCMEKWEKEIEGCKRENGEEGLGGKDGEKEGCSRDVKQMNKNNSKTSTIKNRHRVLLVHLKEYLKEPYLVIH